MKSERQNGTSSANLRNMIHWKIILQKTKMSSICFVLSFSLSKSYIFVSLRSISCSVSISVCEPFWMCVYCQLMAYFWLNIYVSFCTQQKNVLLRNKLINISSLMEIRIWIVLELRLWRKNGNNARFMSSNKNKSDAQTAIVPFISTLTTFQRPIEQTKHKKTT